MKTENFSLASATASQFFRVLTRVIRYDEGSGTGTPKIRVRSLSSGELDVEMQPGRQIRLPFAIDGIVIENLTANPITGKITIGSGDVSDNSLVGTVTLDAATLAALETIGLDAATQQAIGRPEAYTNSYDSVTAMGALAPDTVFTAGANANGAIVWNASILDYAATTGISGLSAKASAPTTMVDGELILCTENMASTGGIVYAGCSLKRPVKIAAGKGLYYINSAGASGSVRQVLYTLL